MKKNIFLLEPQLNIKDDLKLFYDQKLQNPNYHQDKFELFLKNFLNTDKEVCVLSSGTAGLHLSLILSNVSKGDVVFCSNSTFIASVNPILYLNATPCFIEINKKNGNMDMDYLEEAIKYTVEKGRNPKAVIVTHSYGVPSDMNRLIEIKEKYNLSVIEDSAEALGSKYNNQYCGTLADFGVFSFNTNKLNTTFGGGAIVVKDLKYKMLVKKYSSHYKSMYYDFKHEKLAYNYRMNDFAAYIGCKQIPYLQKELNKKKEIHTLYRSYFGKNLISLSSNENDLNYWLNCLNVKSLNFDNLFSKLNKERIEIRRVWFPLNKQPFLKEYQCFGVNQSINFYNETICLPSSINLSKKDVLFISEIILNEI